MAAKRPRIVSAIATRLAGILTTGGYSSNLGQHVITSRPRTVNPDGSVGWSYVEPSELPCVILRDPITRIGNDDTDSNLEKQLDVEFEIRVEGGTVTEGTLRGMISDVYRAIGTDPTWSGVAEDSRPVTDEMHLLQSEKIVGVALIKIVVFYIASAWGDE